jgi:hypothetical protein
MVHPRWYEEKHPQETPTARTAEKIAVRNPAPELDRPEDFIDGFVLNNECDEFNRIGQSFLTISDEAEDQQQLLEVDRQ